MWTSAKVKILVFIIYVLGLLWLFWCCMHMKCFFIGVENLGTGCKENMAIKFEMKDIAMGYYSLGLEVWYRLWAR